LVIAGSLPTKTALARPPGVTRPEITSFFEAMETSAALAAPAVAIINTAIASLIVLVIKLLLGRK
jgi:hypothetical protein